MTILSICIVVFLLIKLNKKQEIEKSQLEQYQKDLNNAIKDFEQVKFLTSSEQQKLKETKQQLQEAQVKYVEITNVKYDELNRHFSQLRLQKQQDLDVEFAKRQQNLDAEFVKKQQEKEEFYNLLVQGMEKDAQKQANLIQESVDSLYQEQKEKTEKIIQQTNYLEERFTSLLAPLQQYEKDQQAKLFYTIQIPMEYRNDIEFLLVNVSSKIQHPDIINKLIWTEYIKPNLDNTFKRVGIEAKSGIYKITNINTGKSYIGKSTDIKKRLSDHFKSSIGISTIAHQEIHDAIFKEGLWNWSVECLTYCEKEQLSELEKYYIDFFKTQTYGFNKREGG